MRLAFRARSAVMTAPSAANLLGRFSYDASKASLIHWPTSASTMLGLRSSR